MLALRADPWMPDYGMGFQVAEDAEPAEADPAVETTDWSQPIEGTLPQADGVLWFVDGVRRVELRLLAEDDGRRAPGLFGSFAVGAVRAGRRAEFSDLRVGRVLVTGGGLRSDPFEVRVGGIVLSFAPVSEAGTEPDQPLARMQSAMRDAEGALAAEIASAGTPTDVVLADGPLKSLVETSCPVVGVVKRFERAYLEGEHDALLARLGFGQRTPLFGLGSPERGMDRYAWYQRLVPHREPWHGYAGLVRCEVRSSLGLDAAVAIAARVTGELPRFAGGASDPRTPQNLAPVAALEDRLRRRLGHAGLVRRALMGKLLEDSVAA